MVNDLLTSITPRTPSVLNFSFPPQFGDVPKRRIDFIKSNGTVTYTAYFV